MLEVMLRRFEAPMKLVLFDKGKLGLSQRVGECGVNIRVVSPHGVWPFGNYGIEFS